MAEQPSPPPSSRDIKEWRWTLVGIGTLFLLWWGVSQWTGPLLLASPTDTFHALGKLLTSHVFYENTGLTLFRVGTALLFATTIGAGLAGLALLDKRIACVIEPVRRVCSTIPPVIIVVVVMFWLGMGSNMIITFGALILWPVMYISLLEGSAYCDAELRETARAFHVTLINRLRHFYLPALAPACMSAAVQITCSAIRVTILAEVIGADKGMGAAIVASARNLAVDQMTAWALVVLLLAAVAEFVLLAPMRKRTYQWKQN
ncbi:TPA: hypothetical protein DDW35_00855 [Candidatus Sumerlaeota bacterium]|jgi:NitT/TauT family transport system permease protein|nr:hypothetical protein [Candidatus Sumerlaeota bacterium]